MTTASDNVAWLTQEAYDTLQAELEQLMGPARMDIAKRIDAARQEGDLSENGGYHAAKDEQGKQEARIRALQDLLLRAKVGEQPADDGVVEQGMRVVVRFAGDSDTEEFLLGSRELLSLDPSVTLDVYSPQSPMGSALMGKSVGDSASYDAPNGRSITVEVVAAEPYVPSPAS